MISALLMHPLHQVSFADRKSSCAVTEAVSRKSSFVMAAGIVITVSCMAYYDHELEDPNGRRNAQIRKNFETTIF